MQLFLELDQYRRHWPHIHKVRTCHNAKSNATNLHIHVGAKVMLGFLFFIRVLNPEFIIFKELVVSLGSFVTFLPVVLHFYTKVSTEKVFFYKKHFFFFYNI